MKRFGFLTAILVCVLALSACAAIQERVDASAYEKIHRQLLSMESFMAQTTVTYISNNNTHVYETTQHAKTSGEYRIEVTSPPNVAGNITVFDGVTISQFNPRVDGRVSQTTLESPERLEILLTSFVRNFIRSQEVSITAANVDESAATVIEAQIPGEHPYMAISKLWVNNETQLPMQMIIYDANNAERVIVIYNSFEYNIDIDDSMFKVD